MKKTYLLIAIFVMAFFSMFAQIPLRSSVVNQMASGDTIQWKITPSTNYWNSTNPFIYNNDLNIKGTFLSGNATNYLSHDSLNGLFTTFDNTSRFSTITNNGTVDLQSQDDYTGDYSNLGISNGSMELKTQKIYGSEYRSNKITGNVNGWLFNTSTKFTNTNLFMVDTTTTVKCLKSLFLQDSLFAGGTPTSPNDTIIPTKIDYYNFKKIGIGIASNLVDTPDYIRIHSPYASNEYIHFTNQTTGSTATDGTLFGIAKTGAINITNQEASGFVLSTGGTNRILANSSGQFAFNNATISATNQYYFPCTYAAANPSFLIASSNTTNVFQVAQTSNAASGLLANPIVIYDQTYSGTTTTSFGMYLVKKLKIGSTAASVSAETDIVRWKGLAANYYTEHLKVGNNNGTRDTLYMFNKNGMYIGQAKNMSYTYADSALNISGCQIKPELVSLNDDVYVRFPDAKTMEGKIIVDSSGVILKVIYFYSSATTEAPVITTNYGKSYITTAVADTDGSLCLVKTGTRLAFKNRKGATVTAKIFLFL